MEPYGLSEFRFEQKCEAPFLLTLGGEGSEFDGSCELVHMAVCAKNLQGI
jgi:hypothetical protein